MLSQQIFILGLAVLVFSVIVAVKGEAKYGFLVLIDGGAGLAISTIGIFVGLLSMLFA